MSLAQSLYLSEERSAAGMRDLDVYRDDLGNQSGRTASSAGCSTHLCNCG